MSELELFICRHCGAPLHIPEGDGAVRCEYCHYPARVSEPAPAFDAPSRLLDEAVSISITPENGVSLLARGESLPIAHTVVISTLRDDQESISVDLCAGNEELPRDNRSLVSLSLPLEGRGLRGSVSVGLTIAVSLDGATTISMKETGVDNAVMEDELQLAVGQ